MTTNTAQETTRATSRAFLSLVRSIVDFAGRKAAFGGLYILLGAVFESMGLVLLIPLFGLVVGNGSGGGLVQRVSAQVFAALGTGTQFGRLSLLLGGFAVLMVIRGIVISLRDSTILGLQTEYIEHLRGQLAEALAAAGWDQVLRLRHARIMSIMSGDIQRLSAAAHYLLQASIAIIILLVQTVLSFVLSPGLALISFALLIAGALSLAQMMRRARSLGRYVSVANLTLIDTVSQFLSGLKLALSQDLQGGFASEFRETIEGLTRRQNTYYRQQVAGRVALTTILSLVGALVILIGFGLFHLPAPILITFLLVAGRMAGPATQILQGFQQLAHGLPAYETIRDLIAELRPPAKPSGLVPRDVPQGPILLDAVAFQHPHLDETGSHGVRRASLHLARETFVGIAGTSGAGKTTLADLLVGLLKPQAGTITVGGIPLDDAMLASWRAQLSYVSQDPFLFHDTVRRNLRWAKPEVSEDQMWEALTIAGADGIVRRMDHGLDTVVGERGSLVSGGERQRIALARALLRRPALLVMDEATNAIDVDGERVLIERLLAIRPRLTIVMIAHRAESLALCDRVLHMEKGELGGDAMAASQLAG